MALSGRRISRGQRSRAAPGEGDWRESIFGDEVSVEKRDDIMGEGTFGDFALGT